MFNELIIPKKRGRPVGRPKKNIHNQIITEIMPA